MKTRAQIYRREAAAILRDISSYHCIRRDQMLRLYPGKEAVTENLLNHLTRQGRIFYDLDTELYRDSAEAQPEPAMLCALWVLLDFIDKVEYHSAVDPPAQLVFLAEGVLYEVLYASPEREALLTCAAVKSDADRRIVIVERPEQISRLDIPGAVYCTVEISSGAVQYYTQEERYG